VSIAQRPSSRHPQPYHLRWTRCGPKPNTGIYQLRMTSIHSPRTSRSPSATVESVPYAEYQEWPFQGFLKRTKIGDDVTYNLEFKLPSISEHLHLPINPAVLDINRDAAAHSKIHQAPSKPKKSKVPWTEEEDIKLLQMWNESRSWEYIFAELPHRSEGSIRVRCSTKFKKRPRTGAGRS